MSNFVTLNALGTKIQIHTEVAERCTAICNKLEKNKENSFYFPLKAELCYKYIDCLHGEIDFVDYELGKFLKICPVIGFDELLFNIEQIKITIKDCIDYVYAKHHNKIVDIKEKINMYIDLQCRDFKFTIKDFLQLIWQKEKKYLFWYKVSNNDPIFEIPSYKFTESFISSSKDYSNEEI